MRLKGKCTSATEVKPYVHLVYPDIIIGSYSDQRESYFQRVRHRIYKFPEEANPSYLRAAQISKKMDDKYFQVKQERDTSSINISAFNSTQITSES